MGRYLELRRSFQPGYHRAGVWGFMPWDTNFYYRATLDRNQPRDWPYTTIPRFLQDRLRNPPKAVANGFEYPQNWSRRLRRLLRVRKHWPAYRIVHHE